MDTNTQTGHAIKQEVESGRRLPCGSGALWEKLLAMERRDVGEMVVLGVVIAVVWCLLSLPIIFYHSNRGDSEEQKEASVSLPNTINNSRFLRSVPTNS